MNFLRNLLGFLLFLLFLILVTGGGYLYYTQGSFFGHTDHQAQQPTPTEKQPSADQQQPNVLTQQQVAQIISAFLNQYADELNKSAKIINEANGLIMADPFFTTPPAAGGTRTTPYDNLLPSVADVYERYQPVLPSYYFYYEKQNMRDVHRGIYKLAQGMTTLDQVLEKINRDVAMLKKDPYYLPPQAFQPAAPPVNVYPYYPPGYQPPPQYQVPNMANHQMGTAGFNNASLSNGIYMLIVVLFFIGMVAIGGYVLSLFRKPNSTEQ